MCVLLIDGDDLITAQQFPDELATRWIIIVAHGQDTEGLIFNPENDSFLLLYLLYKS